MTNPSLHLFLPLSFSLFLSLSILFVSFPSLLFTDPLPDDPGSKLGLPKGSMSADSCLPGHQDQGWSRIAGCAVALQGGSKLVLINSSLCSVLPHLYLTCSLENTHTHTYTNKHSRCNYLPPSDDTAQTNTAKQCAILTIHHNSAISWL